MNLARTSRLLTLAGFVTVFAFAADIVVDSIADLQGDHCVSQSSESDSDHEKTPCSHCSCAVHNGSAVAFSESVTVADGLGASLFTGNRDASAPVDIPAAIDHPPQLA